MIVSPFWEQLAQPCRRTSCNMVVAAGARRRSHAAVTKGDHKCSRARAPNNPAKPRARAYRSTDLSEQPSPDDSEVRCGGVGSCQAQEVGERSQPGRRAGSVLLESTRKLCRPYRSGYGECYRHMQQVPTTARSDRHAQRIPGHAIISSDRGKAALAHLELAPVKHNGRSRSIACCSRPVPSLTAVKIDGPCQSCQRGGGPTRTGPPGLA